MIAKMFEWINAKMEILIAVCLFLITAVNIAQVVFRYVFHHSFTWIDEVSIICFAYLTFLGIGVAYSQKRHMYIDALLIVLPKSVTRVLNWISFVISVLFLMVLGWGAAYIMFLSYKMKSTTVSLEIPMQYIQVSLLLGCILLLAQMIIKARNK